MFTDDTYATLNPSYYILSSPVFKYQKNYEKYNSVNNRNDINYESPCFFKESTNNRIELNLNENKDSLLISTTPEIIEKTIFKLPSTTESTTTTTSTTTTSISTISTTTMEVTQFYASTTSQLFPAMNNIATTTEESNLQIHIVRHKMLSYRLIGSYWLIFRLNHHIV